MRGEDAQITGNEEGEAEDGFFMKRVVGFCELRCGGRRRREKGGKISCVSVSLPTKHRPHAEDLQFNQLLDPVRSDTRFKMTIFYWLVNL
uniref:Uncharacterized protein n=1 Tax=Brassica oleracea TaxID=3712 RepID=A0A3P6A7K0_BRAOL|nr:unnamed protein product [Brassica oleracea]